MKKPTKPRRSARKEDANDAIPLEILKRIDKQAAIVQATGGSFTPSPYFVRCIIHELMELRKAGRELLKRAGYKNPTAQQFLDIGQGE